MSVPVRVENSVSPLKFLTVNDVINFEPLNKVENTEKTGPKNKTFIWKFFKIKVSADFLFGKHSWVTRADFFTENLTLIF